MPVRPESLARHPRYLCLERLSAKIEAAIRCDTKVSGALDVLWVAVKSRQLVPGLNTIPCEALGMATIVPLLNGIDHVKLLRSRFNQDCVVPATISVESERLAPGRFIQHSPFVRLALSVKGEHKLDGLAARLRHSGFSCEFQADEKTMLWSKLAFLPPFALTGTASDKDKQGIFADAKWRGRLESAIGEACGGAAGGGGTLGSEKNLAHLRTVPATKPSPMPKEVASGPISRRD